MYSCMISVKCRQTDLDLMKLQNKYFNTDGDLHPKNLFSLYADAVVSRYQVDTT
jgi:hypothetical protein